MAPPIPSWGTPQAHSLSGHPTASSLLRPFSGDLEGQDELAIDWSLDIPDSRHRDTHTATARVCPSSNREQAASEEADLIERLIDPQDDLRLADEPISRAPSPEPSRATTYAAIDAQNGQPVGSRQSISTVRDAEQSESTERAVHGWSPNARTPGSAGGGQEDVQLDLGPTLPSCLQVLCADREAGLIERQPTTGANGWTSTQAEPRSEEEEDELPQNGPLQGASVEPRVPVHAGVRATAAPDSRIRTDTVETAPLRKVDIEGLVQNGESSLACRNRKPVINPPPSCTRGRDSSPKRGTIRKRQLSPSLSSSPKPQRKRFRYAVETIVSDIESIDRPAFWDGVAELGPGTPLWIAVVSLELDGAVDASSRPLALICTQPLGLIPSVRNSVVLFIGQRLDRKQPASDRNPPVPGLKCRITNAGPFAALSVEQLDLATRWTREALNLHVDRVVPSNLGPQKYLLLPMTSQHHDATAVEKVVIDWEEMRMLDRGVSWPMTEDTRDPLTVNDLHDKVLFNPLYPCRRLLVGRRGWMPRTPILEPDVGTSNTAGSSRASDVWSIVVDGSEASHPQEDVNVHEPFTTDALYRFGTDLRVSFLSTSVFRSTSILPAMSSAIEDTLLGLELSRKLFDGLISPQATLTALTRPAAAQWDTPQCCERQELLGDTVLHLLCAISLRCGPCPNAIQSAAAKRAMLQLESNDNLGRLALETGLLPYIRHEPLWEAIWGASGSTVFEKTGVQAHRTISLTLKVRSPRANDWPQTISSWMRC